MTRLVKLDINKKAKLSNICLENDEQLEQIKYMLLTDKKCFEEISPNYDYIDIDTLTQNYKLTEFICHLYLAEPI